MTGIVSQNVGRASGLIKAVSAGGTWTLISTFTSDGSDATASFTSGIDSTYPIYLFKWINIHPETNAAEFGFQVNASDASGYNETITSSGFDAYHQESGDTTNFAYNTGLDQAQGTALQVIAENIRSDADSHASGFLWLFDPSSTVFQKRFLSRSINMHDNLAARDTFTGGYINTTTAIDDIQFKFSSGEIQAGKIKMYGLGDS